MKQKYKKLILRYDFGFFFQVLNQVTYGHKLGEQGSKRKCLNVLFIKPKADQIYDVFSYRYHNLVSFRVS